MTETDSALSGADVKAEEERQEVLSRTWRVLMRAGSTHDELADPLWRELEPVTTTGRFVRVTAAELGERWGEGEYLLIRADEQYDVRTVRVVAHVEYDDAYDDEAAV